VTIRGCLWLRPVPRPETDRAASVVALTFPERSPANVAGKRGLPAGASQAPACAVRPPMSAMPQTARPHWEASAHLNNLREEKI
jgi:hypothetical protein